TAYMKYGSNPDLRKELHTAYVTRAPQNEDIIEKILTLRSEKAKLLGYKNHAEVKLLTNMADSPEQVLDFLDRLKEHSLPHAEKDKEDLLKFTKEEYGVVEVSPCDSMYYVNKHKEKYYDLKTEDLKPYFEQSSVLEGM